MTFFQGNNLKCLHFFKGIIALALHFFKGMRIPLEGKNLQNHFLTSSLFSAIKQRRLKIIKLDILNGVSLGDSNLCFISRICNVLMRVIEYFSIYQYTLRSQIIRQGSSNRLDYKSNVFLFFLEFENLRIFYSSR